jgi:multicomponent Na+:H+ antiporter subunit D
VQTTLFLATGLVERIGGTTSINRLGGILKASPFVSVLFFIGAMNLGGIPPFSGFLGKIGLFEAGVALGTPLTYVLIAVGALTSLLTLYALVRVWNMAFWRSESEVEGYSSPLLHSLAEDPEDEGVTVTAKRVPALMLTASTGMVVLTVCLTVFAGPLFDLAARTASDFDVSSTYVDAVFPGGVE